VWLGLGALAGLTAVAMAALSAHALAGLEPAARGMVDSGVRMQGWHALALVGCGIWARRGGGLAHLAGAAFTLGVVLFCGAVYALGVFGHSWGLAAPAGGILLMAGWALLGLSTFVAR
jgi:uncharacterized membrane protein YgdD (TMEM256/DUF423 family)